MIDELVATAERGHGFGHTLLDEVVIARRFVATRPALPQGTVDLTPRELEVLRLLAEGWSNKRIADRLVISPRTVGVHVSHVLRKLEVRTRGEASAVAHRSGLLPSPPPTPGPSASQR